MISSKTSRLEVITTLNVSQGEGHPIGPTLRLQLRTTQLRWHRTNINNKRSPTMPIADQATAASVDVLTHAHDLDLPTEVVAANRIAMATTTTTADPPEVVATVEARIATRATSNATTLLAKPTCRIQISLVQSSGKSSNNSITLPLTIGVEITIESEPF